MGSFMIRPRDGLRRHLVRVPLLSRFDPVRELVHLRQRFVHRCHCHRRGSKSRSRSRQVRPWVARRTEKWAGLRKSRPKSAHPLDQRGLESGTQPREKLKSCQLSLRARLRIFNCRLCVPTHPLVSICENSCMLGTEAKRACLVGMQLPSQLSEML
jgi:hypothetical protein